MGRTIEIAIYRLRAGRRTASEVAALMADAKIDNQSNKAALFARRKVRIEGRTAYIASRFCQLGHGTKYRTKFYAKCLAKRLFLS